MADIFLYPYVRTMWSLLHERLRGQGRFCLYGAGAHTRWLLSVTADLPRHSLYAVIDDDPACDEIDGVPVVEPDGIEVGAIDAIVISSDQWESQMAQRASDRWGDEVEIIRLYENLPPGPYDKQDDRELCRLLKEQGSVRSTRSTSRRVVIVSSHPKAREAKLALAIGHAGWEPMLLYGRAPSYDPCRYFADAMAYDSEWHALRVAVEWNPAVIHAVANSDYRLAARFVEDSPVPVVVDSYDLIAGMYTDAFLASHPSFAEEIAREQFCLERADGVCCRSREVDYLETTLGYRSGPRLLFPDGCWNQPVLGAVASNSSRGRRRVDSNAWHTVYVGHLHPAETPDNPFHAHGSKYWLAETLAAQGVHLHVYPFHAGPRDPINDYVRYRELESRSPYFHLHEPVPPDQLIGEISQYDLALFVYNELSEPGCVANTYSDAKFRMGASNKIFDFVDAGLPVAHTAYPGSFQSSLLADNGILINLHGMDPADWRTAFDRLDYASLTGRASEARTALDVRTSATGLVAFYEMLIRNGRSGREPGDSNPGNDHYDYGADEHQSAFV